MTVAAVVEGPRHSHHSGSGQRAAWGPVALPPRPRGSCLSGRRARPMARRLSDTPDQDGSRHQGPARLHGRRRHGLAPNTTAALRTPTSPTATGGNGCSSAIPAHGRRREEAGLGSQAGMEGRTRPTGTASTPLVQRGWRRGERHGAHGGLAGQHQSLDGGWSLSLQARVHRDEAGWPQARTTVAGRSQATRCASRHGKTAAPSP